MENGTPASQAAHVDSSLLEAITAFCQREKIAESTFGRLAVNDGKFVSRLRDGSRVTPETWEKVTGYISTRGGKVPAEIDPSALHVMSRDHLNLQSRQAATESLSARTVRVRPR